MTNKYHQISLKDTFSDCKDMFMDDIPSFFQLLEQHFDISLFIPQNFYHAFYQHLGRKRDYPLTDFLSALILQKIFPIPAEPCLFFCCISAKNLGIFAGFPKLLTLLCLPASSWVLPVTLNSCFNRWLTTLNSSASRSMLLFPQFLTFDTSSIELYVTENNPKTLNSLIRKLKTYYKNSPNVDPYKMTYGLMPPQAFSSPVAKQLYINGRFCYADKFAILTNRLGIIRHITFLDDDFKLLILK